MTVKFVDWLKRCNVIKDCILIASNIIYKNKTKTRWPARTGIYSAHQLILLEMPFKRMKKFFLKKKSTFSRSDLVIFPLLKMFRFFVKKITIKVEKHFHEIKSFITHCTADLRLLPNLKKKNKFFRKDLNFSRGENQKKFRPGCQTTFYLSRVTFWGKVFFLKKIYSFISIFGPWAETFPNFN